MNFTKTHKLTILLYTLILSQFVLIGCGVAESAPSGTASKIADKIFEESGVTFRAPERVTLDNDEDREFYLGSTDYPEFTDSVAVVPMIRVDTRVLYIIKATNKGDVEKIKTTLKENINPDRLVCVRFTLEDVIIESRGNVIFMIINPIPEEKEALAEAFRTIE
ncbi:MAG TPA: hypothetical protein G4O15_02545 [Dehalococcoidia bacterium]|nr:hypothetical protein [Dehalococcoidia bacterium]